MIAVLRNKRASTPIFTAIMVLVFAMIISAVMYVAYVQIQTTNIRNAMKTGLSNLAYTISEDTYTALRESNFDEYADRLTRTSSYRTMLEETYRADVASTVPLSTSEYRITDISLDFTVEGKKIRYTCTCDVTFYVNIFGNTVPAEVTSVEISGSHTAKYGR